MRKRTCILLSVFIALLVISVVYTNAQDKTVRHDNKKFEFESGHFKVVGELRARISRTHGGLAEKPVNFSSFRFPCSPLVTLL